MTPTSSLCFLLMVFQITNAKVPGLKPEAEDCINDLNLNRDEIIKLDDQDIIPEDNPKFGAFLECYWQKLGWQDNSTGEIAYDGIKTMFRNILLKSIGKESPLIRIILKQVLYNIIEECRDQSLKGLAFGQQAAKLQNCIIEMMKKIVEEVQMHS